MATGKASEVESTVPSNARAYRVVGFCSMSKSSSAEDLGIITAVSNLELTQLSLELQPLRKFRR